MNEMSKQRIAEKNKWVSLIIFLLVVVVWSMWQTNFNPIIAFSSLNDCFVYIWNEFLPPDFSSLSILIQPLLDTIYMSFVAMVVSVIISFFFAFFASSKTTPHESLQYVFRGLASVLRTVPSLVWVILLVGSVGLGTLAGTLALILAGVGMLTRSFAEIMDGIEEGQMEALYAAGATWWQVMFQCVLPQFIPGMTAWSLYMFDVNIRDSSIIGMVGGGGIGFAIDQNLRLFQFKTVSMAIFLVLLLVLGIEYITKKLRERIL